MLSIRSGLHLCGYSLYLTCAFLVRPIPLPALFLLGKALGLFASFFLRRRRLLAVSNLKTSLRLNKTDAQKLARQHFMNLGANILCMLKVPSMSDATVWRHVTFEISPQVSQQAAGKGLIAVLAHMSNWELLARLSRLFPQHRFGAIYQKLANANVNQHFNKSRARMGITLFDRKEGFWNAVSFLELGGVLGVLADQYAGVSGTWMPFFGRLTSTSTLAAALAQRVGVEIVPVVITTTGLARWHVVVGNPLGKGDSPESMTATINQELERQITASPADWLWSHDRWKTPHFGFLLTASKRRVFVPPRFHHAQLVPYRIVVRSVDDPTEAKLTIPAVQAIKRGRPDVHLTIVSTELLATLWKTVVEVDEVLSFSPIETPLRVARTIARSGPYDVGVLLSAKSRSALEMLLAGVPYRLGPPARFFLNTWRNPPGQSDPESQGAERYQRIVAATGAAIQERSLPADTH